jgi:PIN domain nuclease of toxin-antitoxin system
LADHVVILLDTHTWLWWVQGASAPLPPTTAERIRTADLVAVASVSCLEVAWLAKKGRIVLPGTVESFFDEALGKAGLNLLPLTPSIAAKSAALPDIHRDPIDRVIVATALEHGADLLSKDELVAKYPGVRVHWDA